MQTTSLATNRAFLYGDAVFETVKILNNTLLFAEDHYFRLMASMRILRMEIPMHFTLEFFEQELLTAAQVAQVENSARARITVFRKDGGRYLPENNEVEYLISVSALEHPLYQIADTPYEIDLYKDFLVTKQLLSTLKTTNRMVQITGSIFAHENGLANCLVLNDDKNVVEALNGNLFLVQGNTVKTPPISEGCLNGIMRKQILSILKTIDTIEVLEDSISPFELQKADELFITNVITGIQPVTRYRKKEFVSTFSKSLLGKLNAKIRLS